MLVTLPNRRVPWGSGARRRPRVVAQLLDAQRDAVLLGVELEHLGLQFLADLNHFARVAHTAPGHVGDVQQAVDAAEVDEGAVLGDVLDHAVTMAPSVSVSSSLARSSPIEASTTARRDSTTLLRLRSSLMTLNSMVLPSNGVMSLTGTRVEQRAGQEGADAVDQTVRPPLTLPLTVPVTNSPDSSAFQRQPGGQALGLVARQDGVAM